MRSLMLKDQEQQAQQEQTRCKNILKSIIESFRELQESVGADDEAKVVE